MDSAWRVRPREVRCQANAKAGEKGVSGVGVYPEGDGRLEEEADLPQRDDEALNR